MARRQTVTALPRIVIGAWVLGAGAWLAPGGARAQLLPPPGDGDIRAVHWELQNVSEIWVTLEPKSAAGKPAPMITVTRRFAGKWPVSQAADLEIRTYAGLFWAPAVEFWLLLDDRERIDLAAQAGPYGLISGSPSDYLSATVPVETVRRMARSTRVTGNALGFEFELNASQRHALGAFLERALSANPIGLPRLTAHRSARRWDDTRAPQRPGRMPPVPHHFSRSRRNS